MFQKNIIDELDGDESFIVKKALAQLAGTTIFVRQEQALLARLTQGAESQDDVELAKQVKQFRAKRTTLNELRIMGESYQKEFE